MGDFDPVTVPPSGDFRCDALNLSGDLEPRDEWLWVDDCEGVGEFVFFPVFRDDGRLLGVVRWPSSSAIVASV